MAKYTMGSTGNLCKHYERGKNSEGETVRYSNQEIDLSRSHLNYNLAPSHPEGQVGFLRQRLSEVHHQQRADLITMCTWVVTLPKEISSPAGAPLEMTDAIERDFFQQTYNFLANKYGVKNVISAYVHKDEHQPHMHFSFVPVVYDKKNDRDKISAKELLTRTALQRFHPELEAYLNQHTKVLYPVLNDATKDGNRTVAELKKQVLIEEVSKLSEEKKTLQKAVKASRSDLKTLAAATLPPEDIASIEITKGLIGDTAKITLHGKPLTYAQAKRLRSMVSDYTTMKVERDLAVKASIRAKKETEEVIRFWDTKKKLAISTDKLQLDLHRAEGRLGRMERRLQSVVDKLPDWVPDRVRDFLQQAITAILQDKDPNKTHSDRGMEL